MQLLLYFQLFIFLFRVILWISLGAYTIEMQLG